MSAYWTISDIGTVSYPDLPLRQLYVREPRFRLGPPEGRGGQRVAPARPVSPALAFFSRATNGDDDQNFKATCPGRRASYEDWMPTNFWCTLPA